MINWQDQVQNGALSSGTGIPSDPPSPNVQWARYLRTTTGVIYVWTGAAWIEEASGGGTGAPADAPYLVTTSNGDLSAEVVVGATPGGELGGTWASPTVDATHSGSTHAAAQSAAEATAAAALSSHAGAADPHTGYLKESDAATTVAANPPQSHAASHAKGGADALATQAPVAFVKRTAGDLTTGSGGFAEINSALRLTLAAVAGDIIEVSINGIATAGATSSAVIDACTIVSNAIVNRFGGGTNGSVGWFITSNDETNQVTGSAFYVVQAGDLSGGNVTLSLASDRVGGSNNATINASATNPLFVFAKNHRQ